MKHRTLRGVAALTLGASLLLAGCASGDGGSEDENSPSPSASDAAASAPEDVAALESVTVTGDPGSEPTLEFETPFEVSGPVAISLGEGDGDPIETGKQITMHTAAYSGADGSKLGSTWEADTPEQLVLDDTLYPQLLDVLEGTNVGTRFLFASPSPDQATGETVTYLTVAEVTGVQDAPVTPDPADVPDRAEGEAVTPAEGLPVVTLDDSGKPSIEIPEGYEAPSELVVQPLIKGSGPEVTADQTVIAHYTGWKLDGEQFDSSWDRGEPATFPLNGVVAGWSQGLTGQTVGSQVLLVIPPELGYGASEGHELQNETLVFVVDILAAY
ncbi:FKBP-type peptidyl-prolyl cis-trans isomerase [Cellulosimicrobium sp. CUA-896]|uniref:FKBP-type peptidyl-prolyl cis-trans isomerase n=1 Tax=Cellulosimicrobium sp. CUA-896 TaxID=1517881 RepID=UPI0009F9FD75|nr:FKBP-type peptidyl-prolyl cis-trans isomerase [Cellulosimicrobium sp. CUA-896]